MKPETRLIIALDVDTLAEAAEIVDRVGPSVEWYKVGKQLFTRHGPAAVELLKGKGKKVFLDLKFHDIPNTVGQAVRSACALGADMVNVHVSGGPAMCRAAAEAGEAEGILLVGVTVLTSMNSAELSAVGVSDSPGAQVVRLARLGQACGLAGVVCSALEIPVIREACGDQFQLVVPGIRPSGADKGDQQRVMTPGEASAAGADFIVVGRPITQAPVPAEAAQAVLEELRQARKTEK